jgi:hypothetical protein
MLSAAIAANEIVPVRVIGPPVNPVPVATFVTVPVPEMLLHPNPVPDVHVRAEIAVLHEGTESAVGTAPPLVPLPITVFPETDGRSPMSKERNVGVPLVPSGDAKTEFPLCDASTPVSVPELTTGDPETVKMPGNDRATDVTVPVPDETIHDGTPDAFSDRTVVPLLFPGRLVHPLGPR